MSSIISSETTGAVRGYASVLYVKEKTDTRVGISYPPMPVAKLNASVELYSLLRKLPVPLGRIGLCTVC